MKTVSRARRLLIATLIIFVSSGARADAWKSDSALVFLHRSAGMVAPENTVPAFEAAVRQGADGIETDIRKTRDGVLVIYHDDWVLRQRGPAGKIEEMTLWETRELDVGERFGPQWRGLSPPLFEDLLRFAKANGLRLYLDVKTPGIYEEVLKVVKAQGCMPLVHATGGQVPTQHYALPIPWIQGWNYTEGGEEDPEKMREVIARAPQGVYGIMCDDARSIVRALGRHPEKRPFTPFVSTMWERLRGAARDAKDRRDRRDLDSRDARVRREACIALSENPVRGARELLTQIAESDPDYLVRQDACWALANPRDDRSVPTLLRIARTPYDQKTAGKTEYRDFFLKTAAGCALARLNSTAARAALKTLLDSKAEGDRSAAAIGLAAFGTEEDLETLRTLVAPGAANDGIVASIVAGYAGRFGAKAIPLYLAALGRDDTAKVAVFGLAGMGEKAVAALRQVRDDAGQSAAARKRAGLALRWIEEEKGARARVTASTPKLPQMKSPRKPARLDQIAQELRLARQQRAANEAMIRKLERELRRLGRNR